MTIKQLKPFSLILAAAEDGGIGAQGKLPWRLKGDMEYFKHVTSFQTIHSNDANPHFNAVIMGRKTWESIPERFRPLPGRVNFILSRQKDLNTADSDMVKWSGSLSEALESASQMAQVSDIYVIGGGAVYNEAALMPKCRYVYLTRVHAPSVKDCDTWFKLPADTFRELSASETQKMPQVAKYAQERSLTEPNGISYTFTVYRKEL